MKRRRMIFLASQLTNVFPLLPHYSSFLLLRVLPDHRDFIRFGFKFSGSAEEEDLAKGRYFVQISSRGLWQSEGKKLGGEAETELENKK